MKCQKCQSDRIIIVNGKTSDNCIVEYKGIEHDGYVPFDVGIGGSDYIELDYCLECGQIQGTFPVNDPNFEDEDEEDW